MQREVKVVGLNSCRAMEKGHVVWWVQIYPVPEGWAHQGKKKGRWSDTPTIKPCGRSVMIWGCFGWSGPVCATLIQVSRLHKYTEWPGFSIHGFIYFFFPDDTDTFQNDNTTIHQAQIVERRVQGAWNIIFTNGLATTESRPQPHWESLGCGWRRL